MTKINDTPKSSFATILMIKMFNKNDSIFENACKAKQTKISTRLTN